ncbi:hypothetical protein H5410_062795 [Solanum commersonii]|uniref:Leucine-rich repeat-containing N-terminal plant-type domain-containing protein n=1 Tax=Solanum commersonii TaxID=4109 RepID=A0A9J5WBY1_SOLCO|nr:hypothetical protein H5410_062795 [Solanum commersonii]
MRLLLLLAVVLLVAILANFSSFVNGDTDPSDDDFCLVFSICSESPVYHLNSPGQLTKWNANGGDPCGESWTGITCTGNKVTEIQISGLGLSGSLGSQLDSLKSVTNFDISNNNMRSQLPHQLHPNVQRLNLASSGFSGGLPYSISQMTSLQYLNVSHNQMQGSVVVSFDSLSTLNTLDFSFNSMTGNLPRSFQSLTSMNKMYLQNNQFNGTIDVLANLPLGNLNVENNQFTGWILDQLKEIVQSNGNSWISGPPPGTPPANNPNEDHKSRENSSNSGSRKSDSECLAESCLIVKYGIAHKVKNDAAFNAQFGELNDILSIQSIQLLMEIMQTIALATVFAAASSSGSRTTMSLLVWVQGPTLLLVRLVSKSCGKTPKKFSKKERLACRIQVEIMRNISPLMNMKLSFKAKNREWNL